VTEQITGSPDLVGLRVIVPRTFEADEIVVGRGARRQGLPDASLA
jgi:hypothetical protein